MKFADADALVLSSKVVLSKGAVPDGTFTGTWR